MKAFKLPGKEALCCMSFVTGCAVLWLSQLTRCESRVWNSHVGSQICPRRWIPSTGKPTCAAWIVYPRCVALRNDMKVQSKYTRNIDQGSDPACSCFKRILTNHTRNELWGLRYETEKYHVGDAPTHDALQQSVCSRLDECKPALWIGAEHGRFQSQGAQFAKAP